MASNRHTWALAAIAIAACSPHRDDATAATADRIADWRDDLHALTTAIATGHKNAFFHVSERDWRAQIAALDGELATLDDAHILTRFARVVAAIGDAHTMIGTFGARGYYPLAFVWFDDGIFVVGAPADQRWALGRKLVGVGTHTIDEAVAVLTPLIARDNDVGIRAGIPDVLANPALLIGSDLASADHATFSLAAHDGSIRTLDVRAGSARAQVAPPAALPLHLQGPATNYWNKYLEPEHLLYLAYNLCADDPKAGPFATFAASTLAFADQHPVDRFVIDLRTNEGGDSRILEPLLVGLAARPALAGHVFAIIGMHTFSSAVIAGMALKRRVHAVLVGGPTLGKPNAYGEIKLIKLPHSKLPVQYSTKRFANPDFPGEALTPDVAVRVVADDWFAGRDPALDAIAAYRLAP